MALAGTMTVGEPEEVTVPAGAFRAAKVVWAIERMDGKPVAKPEAYTYWYARGVGLVRMEYPGGEQVLNSFTPAPSRNDPDMAGGTAPGD